MSIARTLGPDGRLHRGRALLIALLGAFHFIAVPCAMAAADGPACGHCEGVADMQPCLSDGAGMSLVQAGPAMDDPRLPPRPSRPLLVVPAIGQTVLPVLADPAVAFHTGRRTGDPPCRLRFGNLRI